MSTITLYASKINQMPRLINDAKKSVKNYKEGLKWLESKFLTIDNSVCNVDDVISSVRSSAQIQEDKFEALDALGESIGEFVADVVRIDRNAAAAINKSKDDFYDKYNYLKPECEKSDWEKLKEKIDLKSIGLWCVEGWIEAVVVLSNIAILSVAIISTWPYSGLALLLLGITISCTGSVGTKRRPPRYTYDETSPQSMADCLGIDYSEYIETMQYHYGFEEEIAQLYLKLYLQVANDPSRSGNEEREIACEFNRMIASLCKYYEGGVDNLSFWLTTGNYKSADAYKMLIEKYDFTEADAIDFAIALNVQHGSACEEVEEHFGFSRENGTLFRGENLPTPEKYKIREGKLEDEFRKDFVHEAVQYVEFNDDFDIVDAVSGSTDRMISYSGDIISAHYDISDFLSDIDPNNIQKRLEKSNYNFLKVQQEYNKAVMDGTIKPKSEFISNNGGVDVIRNNINHDIKSFMGAWAGKEDLGGNYIGLKEMRADAYKSHVDKFIDFLQDQSDGGFIAGET